MLRAIVIGAAPEPLRGHLQLLQISTYDQLKQAIVSYLQAARAWNSPQSHPLAHTSDEEMTLSALSFKKERGRTKTNPSHVSTVVELVIRQQSALLQRVPRGRVLNRHYQIPQPRRHSRLVCFAIVAASEDTWHASAKA